MVLLVVVAGTSPSTLQKYHIHFKNNILIITTFISLSSLTSPTTIRNVPPACSQHNAVHTLLHFLTDLTFLGDKVFHHHLHRLPSSSYLCHDMMTRIMMTSHSLGTRSYIIFHHKHHHYCKKLFSCNTDFFISLTCTMHNMYVMACHTTMLIRTAMTTT